MTLDHEAAALSAERGINFVRAATAGIHPAIPTMLGDLIVQHQNEELLLCAPDCCPALRRPSPPASTHAEPNQSRDRSGAAFT